MKPRDSRGVTLVELMIAMVVLTVGVVGGMGSFRYIAQAISSARLKTIAVNLAQEKMEVLKNKSYYQLLVTSYSATSTGFSPNFTYDAGNYPAETFALWGGAALTRYVNVDFVNASGASVTVIPFTSTDPGMKKISVYVAWTERNTKRKVQLDSYYENPSVSRLSTGFRGQVTSGAANVAGALVQVIGIPKWRAYSDSGGNYSFQVAPGSYTLVCSTPGYYSMSSDLLSVSEGLYTAKDFALTKIGSGTVTAASVYTRDPSLVISQVVTSTIQAGGFDAQYVELFNPTTSAINIGNVASHMIQLNLDSTCGSPRNCQDVSLTYVSTYVPAGGYYLVANTASLTILGSNFTADAYYKDTADAGCATPPSDWSAPSVKRILQTGHNGSVWLTDAGGGVIDAVGWYHNSNVPSHYEGAAIPFNGGGVAMGLGSGDQIVRFSTPCAVGITYGRAYDTDSNLNNFYFHDSPSSIGLGYRPFSGADAVQTVVSGRPSTGAYVFADDGNSAAVTSSNGSLSGPQGQTCSLSSFTLTSVATGTWNVSLVSGNYSKTVANVAVAQGVNTAITNAATSPAWPVANLNYVVIDSSFTGGIASGYVYGSGANYWSRLNNILVASSGNTARTDSNGLYMLSLTTGTATISANYNSNNPNYVTSEQDVTITQGAVTSVPDFHLAQGGFIQGFVTSGSGALPNIAVRATLGSSVFNDTSDNTGYFYIFVSTSSSPWSVAPDLDPLQSYTSLPSDPLTATVTTPGATVFAGTITVIGAMGTITGSVTKSGAAITTGVLIMASTASVSDPPPAVVASSSPAQSIVYSASSMADGTYSLDVRSSTTTTYNIRAFFPAVDINTGAVSYTSLTRTGVSVGAGATTPGQNFTW